MFFYVTIGYFKIFISIIKAEFSASFHDPSEIIPIRSFIINVGNSCAAYFIYLFILNL